MGDYWKRKAPERISPNSEASKVPQSAANVLRNNTLMNDRGRAERAERGKERVTLLYFHEHHKCKQP